LYFELSASPIHLKMSDVKSNELPAICVLGGTGFIGRNVVKFLAERGLASKIIVADKSLPATSYFSPAHKAVFDNKDLVQFKQADLSKDAHVERVFKDAKFDYVINLCGETRFGMKEEDYKVKILDPAVKCAAAAAKAGVSKWVEVSTAQVYIPDKDASNENDKLKPWTNIAKYRLQAEDAVKAVHGLNVVILRPAIVYGSGDLSGLTPRLALAAVYKQLNEKMKLLWGEDLRISTVHVEDVATAIWGACVEMNPGTIYNLSDQTDLTQGKLAEWLGSLFKIDTGFFGSIMSNLAKVNLSGVADDANEKHVPVFTKLCASHSIQNTPISPYIDKELLYNNHLSVDGTRIAKDTAFRYSHPTISVNDVKRQCEELIAQTMFPPVL